MTHRVFIGVDPGLSGAIAFLRYDRVTVRDMPVLTAINNSRNEKDVDALVLYEMLKDGVLSWEQPVVVLEKTQPMKDSAMTAFSMGMSRMAVLAAAAIAEIPIVHVTPQVWKKHFGLLKCSKDASRTLVMERFPSLRDELRYKKDHNRAESVLIALYGREKF